MIDINIIRINPDLVKENIKKKFQDQKLVLVDEVVELDKKNRALKQEGDDLRAKRNKLSSQIGALMREKKLDEVDAIKAEVKKEADRIVEIEAEQGKLAEEIKTRMMVIPNIIDSSVPIGKDDTCNVEVQRFGEPVVPPYEIPYNADILNAVGGLDKESAGRTSGNGFYYLIGDIARLHEAMIAYSRDYMINQGFTYCIPPFMIHSDVVTGVMSFAEMDAMMYKLKARTFT